MDPASSPSAAGPATDPGEAANAVPAAEPHGGEGSASTPPPRKLWTAESPHFDGLTMSAIVLDRLQQHI
jgi:hypothetical protein